jgi:hypothetical protein
MLPALAAAALIAGGVAAAKKGMDSAAAKDRDARKKLQANADQWTDLQTPDYQDVNPEQDRWLGDYDAATYDPSRADTYTVDGTAFDGVSTDPRLKEQQLAALASLTELGKDGMTAQDRANMAKMQAEVNQADRGRREAIQQNMAARGMGGSGMALLAQMQNAQSSTDRAAQQGMDIQGMAQARALQALQQSGSLAGNIRGQDFSEQARVAEAKDAVQRFNAQQQQQGSQYNTSAQNAAAQYNTGAKNEAGMFNARGRQAVASGNVDANNKAQYTNRVTLPGQRFDDTTKKMTGISNANSALASNSERAGDRNAIMWGQVGQGLMGAGSTIATKSDKRAKKDIKEFNTDEIDQFLAALKPKKFKYKEGHGAPGEKIGFIMQDIEKSKAGKAVAAPTEDGMKGYDAQSLQGLTLAALKRLSEKIDDKESK